MSRPAFVVELYVNPSSSRADFTHVPNVDYDQTVARHLIKTIKSSGKFCKSLGPYVYTSIEDSSGVMIVSVDTALFGFATIDIDTKTNMLHVDVLCANKDAKGLGVGTFILDQLMVLATHNGLRGVQLTATNAAAAFYIKNGFTADKNNIMTKYSL